MATPMIDSRVTEFRPGTARRVAPLRDGDRVVIIGAGPAGLTAAYLLAKHGTPVTVVEGSDTVGGISQTARYKGYRFDIGGHRFFTKIAPVEQLWDEILGPEIINVPRLSRISYNGKFFDYPLKPMNALSGLGLWNAFLCVTSYLYAHFRPSPIEDNLEQWVTNRFGKRLYRIFFKTYTEKVWGIPCTEIRAEWAAQRIQGLSLARAIMSAASLNKRSTKIKTLINEFRYPRLGPGQMWEAARDRIVALGGEVLMSHEVTRLDLRDGRVVAVVATGPDGERRIEGDHFISTMAIRNLVRSLDPEPPEAIRAAGEGLKYRDFLTVALMIDRDNLFPDNWIYVHTQGVKVGRIQNFNNWSRAMVPDAGLTCLGLEYFCFEGDGLWTSPDADLIALASRELATLGLAGNGRVVDGTVVRMRKAYPVYDADYRGHLNTVRGFIDRIDNLHTVGRNGMHKYNNQDHSMLTAMMAVANMRGAAHDIWEVNTDFEYHEEQRIELPPANAGARPAGTPVAQSSAG
jgi:protoporphyrinogen oxidase